MDQQPRLFANDLDQARVRVAESVHPNAGDEIEITIARDVGDGSLAAGQTSG